MEKKLKLKNKNSLKLMKVAEEASLIALTSFLIAWERLEELLWLIPQLVAHIMNALILSF